MTYQDWFSSLPRDLVFLVAGVFLGCFFSFYVSRPVLRQDGSGMGSVLQADVTNLTGFIGVRLPITIILGWRLFSQIELGLGFDRRFARNCTADLYDKKTKVRILGSLYWRAQDGSFVHSIDIPPNESRQICILAVHPGAERWVSLFIPDFADGKPKKLPNILEGNNPKDFFVQVSSAGKKMTKFDISIYEGLDGRLHHYIGSKGRGSGGSSI